jgi:AhpD family alkylhydroperoxidase
MHTNALAGTIVEHLRTADKAVEAVLPTLTRKLVKTRASQINGCSFCLHMHTKEAIRAGETPQRLNLVAAWKQAKGFTAAERAALELAEQAPASRPVTVSPTTPGPGVLEHHDEDQLVALVAEIALINAWNRVCVITQQPGGDYQLP